ncbi:bridge-like lipid transfer protein family member 3B isoform X2 [Planococcus citri]|uniref:bridge-like lipid transfer protein family member 3B isoform X2 n=1 Tax=Planococcus citri TaxID=170843 RepID=UPI0031F8CF4E
MASIIKNQILKYLSRYFKNLSNDKINFSTIKGEGELASLELDENALTDLLELPAWMKIKSAKCNKVTFHIPWTRLKSEPMVWNLDEVLVEIETCEELRMPQEVSPNILQQQGKYNTINRVVDGMTINVNSASIKFTSVTFTASLQIIRIKVESKSSAWEKCDLRHTRIKDTKRGQILLFKELRWQTLRIEAQSIIEQDLPPIRLLTLEAVCRLIIKKRLSDCFIMGSKLVLILDELLWVLTDSQLKAALHFLDSLSGLIKKADEVVRKKKAARKLEVLPEYQAQVLQQEMVQNKSAVSHIFACHDVIETSYHFLAQKIDLHLSDDPGPGRSNHPNLQDGAAIHIKLSCFQVDYYPYHLAVKDRTHWGLYRSSRYPHPKWLAESQEEFRNLLLSLVQDDISTSQCSSPISKTSVSQNGVSYQSRSTSNSTLRKYMMAQFNKIMTSCTVIRIGNLVIDRVTTLKKSVPKEFIKADKERYSLPESEILHAEFTYYYYPGDIQFPLPQPKFYVQIYPVQIQFDVITILWLNTFFLNLHKSLLTTSTVQDRESVAQLLYFDVKVEIIMPHIVFEINQEKGVPKDRPRSLHFQVSRIVVTNSRSTHAQASRSSLAKVVGACQMRSLYLSDDFPSKCSDYHVVTDKFINHAQGKDNIRNFPDKLLSVGDNEEDIAKALFQELLWIEAKDVWCIHLESVWGDFYGVRATGNRPVPFLDAFPLTIWLYADPTLSDKSEEKIANVQVLASVTNLISVQINQYQANFLSKISKSISELTTFLTIDTDKVMGDEKTATIVVASIIPQIEITLVTASQGVGKESSGGDIESSSVVPDSSSLDTHSVYWANTVQNSVDNATVEELRKSNNPRLYREASLTYGTDNVVHFQASEMIEVVKPSQSNTFTQFKKGFSNFMSMDFMSKSVDDTDTMSIRSDDSSDTENYLLRNGSDQLYLDDADAMFRINYKKKVRTATMEVTSNIEIADEALCEYGSTLNTPTTTPSEKDSFGSTYKRKDCVAAITLKLNRLEFMMQSSGLNSLIKMQIGSAGVEECFSIPWDELQNKFNTRTRDWFEIDDVKSYMVADARIKLRFENAVHPPQLISASNFNVNLWRDSELNVTINDLLLEVQSQTIKCLTEFLEDQKACNSGEKDKAVLFEILVDNVQLLFKEDYDLSGDSSPIVFRKLRVFRDDSGTIKIQPVDIEIKDSSEEIPSAAVQSMKNEIELLRKRLAAMEYLNEENQTLRQCREETKVLRSCLAAVQDEVAALLEEKRNLLEYIHKLRSSHVSENITCKR